MAGRDSAGADFFDVRPFPAERGRLRPRLCVSKRPAIRVTIREFTDIASTVCRRRLGRLFSEMPRSFSH